MSRPVMLTGDRPTGDKLHIGHLVGTLLNRVKVQDTHDTFILVADLHMLTTKPSKDEILAVRDRAAEYVKTYLSVGIDPAKTTIYLQSAIHAVYEINLLLGMLTTVPRLSRLPSIKDMARSAHLNELPFGLLGYPVLQAADIVTPRANIVPVGKDNEAHIEVTREMVRRFNYLYGDTLPEPASVIEPTLIGTDGDAKMSKSIGNVIYLTDTPQQVAKMVNSMYTDPNRISADVPGKVKGNPVFIYHDLFNSNKAEVEDLKTRYKAGKVGDVEVKQKLTVALNNYLDPIREARAKVDAQPGLAEQVLYEGTIRAQEVANETVSMMKKAMGLTGLWNKISRKGRERIKKLEQENAAAD
ncbi:MAG: tryptophan--tRNA ligase [Anaerolineales bacterium]|nr:tryptophan--tRNA ligase [Anaerolineales bacterium]